MASVRPLVRSYHLLLLFVLGTLGTSGTPVEAADPDLPYGINAHLPSSAVLDRVVEAGISWIRVDFDWVLMEPGRGVYDWSTTDSVVNEARARGLNIFATLAYTPGWANGGLDITVPPTDPADWYTFVFDTVSRYKDSIKHWGMWNEPNLDHFFSGSREQYIQDILRLGAQAAKAADPTCFVLGPELAYLESTHWEAWLYTVLKEAGDVIDIVTHHDYSSTGRTVVREMGVQQPLWKLRTPRGIMVLTKTADKPLWLTETGWRTDLVSEADQADYYVQVLRGVDLYPWLDKVFFYEMVDDPRFPEKWGILNADLTPKEAFSSYRDYIASHPAASAPAPSP